MHFIIFIFLILLIVLVSIIYRETKKVEISYYTVPLPGLSGALENFKIVHITDIHYPFVIHREFLERVKRVVNDEKPDLLVLTGDIITTCAENRMECPEVLGSINSSYGIFAVLGNHDYCYGRKELREKLHECNITVLRNEHCSVGPMESRILLMGLDDPSTFRDDPELLFRDLPDADVKILLTHSPGALRYLLEKQVHLILIGHTHGGQIRIPFLGALYFPIRAMREYDAGWFRRGETLIFVNRGLGFAMIPLRFLCPREFAIITLTSSGSRIIKKTRTLQ